MHAGSFSYKHEIKYLPVMSNKFNFMPSMAMFDTVFADCVSFCCVARNASKILQN